MTDNRFAAVQRWGPAIIASVLAVFGLWFFFALFFSALKIDSPAEYTQVISSLFTSVAVFVAIYALHLQQKNFNAQIAEMNGESFNTTFNMLIKIHNEALLSLSCDEETGQARLYKSLSTFEEKRQYNDIIIPDSIVFAQSTYHKVVDPMFSEIFSYLNTGILILRFIDKNAPQDKKKIYVDIFTSKLARHELVLLMYHLMLSGITKNLINFANEFSLFETIQGEIEGNGILQKVYSPSAFGLTNWKLPE